jgi:uncharacterized protein YktB (UPF0637 family)
MARRSKKLEKEFNSLNQELEALKKHMEDVVKDHEEAVKKEEDEREEAVKKINEICEGNYFCGFVMTPDSLHEIIKLMISNNGNVKIPFNLYPVEEESSEGKTKI